MYGDTPEGMVQSAIEYIQICERHDYHNIVISLKASRVPVMLQANRLMAQRMAELGMDYPLHLGVTEAGSGQYARIKSTAGIGTLLAEGIGDTIRVSLSEDPVEELPACYDILQALRYPAHQSGTDFVPKLRAYQVRSADCGKLGRVGGEAFVRQFDGCSDGLYRERAGRNGGRGLRVRGQSGRQNLTVPGPRGSENRHPAGKTASRNWSTSSNPTANGYSRTRAGRFPPPPQALRDRITVASGSGSNTVNVIPLVVK